MKYLALIFLFSTVGYAEAVEFISSETDAWTISNGQFDGHETQLRFRPNLKKQIGRSDFPRLLTITWEYSPEPSTNSLPYSDDLNLMHAFEDNLVMALEVNNSAIFSHVFTSKGIRKWHFYVKDIEVISEILNSTLEPDLPISLSVKDDVDWSEYSYILKITTKKDND